MFWVIKQPLIFFQHHPNVAHSNSSFTIITHFHFSPNQLLLLHSSLLSYWGAIKQLCIGEPCPISCTPDTWWSCIDVGTCRCAITVSTCRYPILTRNFNWPGRDRQIMKKYHGWLVRSWSSTKMALKSYWLSYKALFHVSNDSRR